MANVSAPALKYFTTNAKKYNELSDKEFLDGTFAIRLVLPSKDHDWAVAVIVVSIREEFNDLCGQLAEMLGVNKVDKIAIKRAVEGKGSQDLPLFLSTGNIIPALLMMKARGGVDHMYTL